MFNRTIIYITVLAFNQCLMAQMDTGASASGHSGSLGSGLARRNSPAQFTFTIPPLTQQANATADSEPPGPLPPILNTSDANPLPPVTSPEDTPRRNSIPTKDNEEDSDRESPFHSINHAEHELTAQPQVNAEVTEAPMDPQEDFFGMGMTRAQVYNRIRESEDERVRFAVVQTLVSEYGARSRAALDSYLRQTLGISPGEDAFSEGRLLEDQALYEAVLDYFFTQNRARFTFHPGEIGLLDALAIVLEARVVVWGVDPTHHLVVQHDTVAYAEEAENVIHLLFENGCFNFLVFEPRSQEIRGLQETEGLTPLMLAAYTGNEEVVRLLLTRGANVNQRDNQGQTALHWAVQSGQEKIVRVLHDEFHVDINQPRADGFLPIGIAALRGHRGLVQCLHYRGVDINHTDRTRRAPLAYAALGGHIEIIDLLADLGVTINPLRPSYAGVNLLELAIESGDEVVVHYLVEEIMGLTDRSTPEQIEAAAKDPVFWNAFYKAVLKNSAKEAEVREQFPDQDIPFEDQTGAIVHFLAAKLSGHLDIRGTDRQTPLERLLDLKSNEDRLVLMRRLAELGADVNLRDERGRTPLSYAIPPSVDLYPSGNKRRTASLARARANLDQDDQAQETPLTLAAAMEITTLLANARADLNQINQLETPLTSAVRNGNPKLVQHLIYLGADVNLSDERGLTPLTCAVTASADLYTADYMEIIILLVQGGADLNQSDRLRETPLTRAVRSNNLLLAQHLINLGANVNQKNARNQSALLVAAHKEDIHEDNKRIALLLLRAGADIKNDSPYVQSFVSRLYRHR